MATAIPSDVKCFQPLLKPANDVDPAGGGVSAAPVANATVGEVMPQLAGLPTGDIDGPNTKIQTQKLFLKLDSTGVAPDGSVAGLVVYGGNWMGTPPGVGVISFQSTNASDDSSKAIQVWFTNAGPTLPIPETVILNGVTLAAGAQAITKPLRCRLVDTATGLISLVAAGDISIFVNGVYVGMIPTGFTWATGEYRMAIEATYNTSTQIANRLTDVTAALGVPLSTPFNQATGLAFGSGAAIPGQIDAQDSQAIWLEETIQPGMPIEPEVELDIAWIGGTAI